MIRRIWYYTLPTALYVRLACEHSERVKVGKDYWHVADKHVLVKPREKRRRFYLHRGAFFKGRRYGRLGIYLAHAAISFVCHVFPNAVVKLDARDDADNPQAAPPANP